MQRQFIDWNVRWEYFERNQQISIQDINCSNNYNWIFIVYSRFEDLFTDFQNDLIAFQFEQTLNSVLKWIVFILSKIRSQMIEITTLHLYYHTNLKKNDIIVIRKIGFCSWNFCNNFFDSIPGLPARNYFNCSHLLYMI